MRPRYAARLILLLAALALASGCAFNTPVLQRGAVERYGVLLNYSCGAHVCDPIDPSKPTIVITHGWNPLPNRIRCTFGPSAARELRCNCGDSYNILSWDWNGVHVPAFGDGPINTGRDQGAKLAAALRSRGVVPSRTHMIAHSLGTVVVAKAARCLADRGRFAQVTLLDPTPDFHVEIFECQRLCRHARCVENYWVDGVSGYGAPAKYNCVRNYEVLCPPYPIRGIVDLSRSSHVYVMQWYYETIRNPGMNCGFQRSVLRHCCRSGQCADGRTDICMAPEEEPSDAVTR